MEILLIIFIALAVAVGLGVTFLFLAKNKKVQTVLFYFVAILGMIIAMMSATSYPSNYVIPQVIAWVFGFLAIAGIVIKNKDATLAKWLVTLSAVLGLLQLFFF